MWSQLVMPRLDHNLIQPLSRHVGRRECLPIPQGLWRNRSIESVFPIFFLPISLCKSVSFLCLSQPLSLYLECYYNHVIFNVPITYYTTQNLLRITHMFVMEQSWNGSHPETHWKHETPLPGCDCITWVTHTSYWQLLLLVIELIGIFSWLGVTFWNFHFGGSGENLNFGGSAFLMTEHVTYCSHLVYSNEIQKINMSSDTCCF